MRTPNLDGAFHLNGAEWAWTSSGLAMRDAVKAEVVVIMEHLQQVNNFQYDLINTNWYLQAENIELTSALNEHDIKMPGPQVAIILVLHLSVVIIVFCRCDRVTRRLGGISLVMTCST